MRLDFLNQRMADGSRLFTVLPGTFSWREIRTHLEALQDLRLGEFLTDEVTEAWLDFTWFGQGFTIHGSMGEYRVFASEGDCPTLILTWLMEHFRRMEEPRP